MAENEIIRQAGEGNGGAYRAFLLRCWREEVSGETPWRFTMVQVGQEHAQRGFASLEDLFSYLRAELENNASRKKL